MALSRVPPTKKPNTQASRGGIVSALRLSAEQRSARSANAGNTLLRRYGIGYYSALGGLSKRKRGS